jgi:nicotinamidase-related amidase
MKCQILTTSKWIDGLAASSLYPPEGGDRKRHSSGFHNTDFHTRLTEVGIGALVVVGIQTEMCVDSTCRGSRLSANSRVRWPHDV